MKRFPIFLTAVVTVNDRQESIEDDLKNLGSFIGELVDDYELVVVDNASTDKTVGILRSLVRIDGLPNLQILRADEIRSQRQCNMGWHRKLARRLCGSAGSGF